MNVPPTSEHDNSSPSQPSRRAVLGLVLGAALGGIGLASRLAEAAKPAPMPATTLAAAVRRRRRPRYRVVTRTFRSGSAIVINDEAPASPYPSLVTVRGLRHGRLLDLNVALYGFAHEYPRDIDLLLVAPNGRGAVILSDVGGPDAVNKLTVVLDDQASVPLSSNALVSGIFQPWNDAAGGGDAFPAPAVFSPSVALASFNGINPNGTWRLYVFDDSDGDTGSIDGWALTIKARVRV
jgi:subtilisin-like proprotein convertase family protein